MLSRITALACAALAAALLASSLIGHEIDSAGAAVPTGPPCATTVAGTVSGSNVPLGVADTNPVAGSGSNISGSNIAVPGKPCWVDIEPYPFGTDGGPVDTTTDLCKPLNPHGIQWTGDRASCYLKVDSLAFRAWNRGLAATSPVNVNPNPGSTTAFGVWIWNGQRWFPDPTFPGQSVCKGDTILWAGKRDYWLVGARLKNWPRVCRFDGVNFEWQPLDIPPDAMARIPFDADGINRIPGAIEAASCLSWDNCWLFGDYGIVLHWDGVALKDASPDLVNNKWLGTNYVAAMSRTFDDGSGHSYAVGDTGGRLKGQQLPSQPDGSPPPFLFSSGGGAFAPLPFTPPTVPVGGDPYRTDLVSVDFDSSGRGWLAGVPVGARAEARTTPPSAPSPDERRSSMTEPAPVIPIDRDGNQQSCPKAPPSLFTFTNGDGRDGYLWKTLSVLPSSGEAVAAGLLRPAAGGPAFNDDAFREPIVAGISCRTGGYAVRFRIPDPYDADPATTVTIPANRTGVMSAVAANASNDLWATTTQGVVLNPDDPIVPSLERPRIYRYTDTTTPKAAPGDDDEPRALVFVPDPPIYIEAPPDPPPAPPADSTVTQRAPRRVKRVKLKPAVYNVKAHVRVGGRGGLFLYVTFRVRRPVTLGVQALRKRKVVASSGLKKFKPKKGTLVLRLSRSRWPNDIRFYGPKKKTKTK